MSYWEVETGPDGLLDLLRDGRVTEVAIADEDRVRDTLVRLKAQPNDIIDVNGRTHSMDEYLHA